MNTQMSDQIGDLLYLVKTNDVPENGITGREMLVDIGSLPFWDHLPGKMLSCNLGRNTRMDAACHALSHAFGGRKTM
jgi:hypothetical protein